MGSGGGGGCIGPLSISDSPLLHFGLSAASMMGLRALGGLGPVTGREPEEEEEEDEGEEGEVLNLSSGVGSRQKDPLSWMVVPSRALFLKPTVVS